MPLSVSSTTTWKDSDKPYLFGGTYRDYQCGRNLVCEEDFATPFSSRLDISV